MADLRVSRPSAFRIFRAIALFWILPLSRSLSRSPFVQGPTEKL
ncbi:hypothetical protein [Limnothrix redekei]|uniref:Uncharacterized protein n=1 Tax=Limnothrix redekei LRLZ20PSL1 TaxID=3112953 RepID=A0ABW7C421_9CYAN